MGTDSTVSDICKQSQIEWNYKNDGDSAERLLKAIFSEPGLDDIEDELEELSEISPKEIKREYLDNKVYGQDQAKKAVSLLLWSHFRGIPRNLLLIGPSGCGKTEIFRAVRDSIYSNVYIFDASNITESGWSGEKKISTVFTDMLSSGFSIKEIEHSIIVFDEFDKLICPKHNNHGENVSVGVQGELLSMIEGTKLSIKKGQEIIDTSKISFVFLGAFEDLYKKEEKSLCGLGFGSPLPDSNKKFIKNDFTIEDIISYGLRTELAGRIGNVVTLESLNEEAFYKILSDKTISPVNQMEEAYRLKISISKKLKKQIAHDAYNNKLGARFLRAELQRLLDEKIFEGKFDDEKVHLS